MNGRHGDRASGSGASSDARELILRCLDGMASDAEAAELGRRVARDPEVARALAEAARFESGLEVALRADSPATIAGEASAPQPVPLRSARRRTLSIAAAITAVAAALAVAWSLSAARHTADSSRTASARSSPKTQPVAQAASPFTSPPGKALPRLRFADGSTAVLRDDRSRIETRLATASAIELDLAEGGARFEVTPRADRRFRVWVASSYVEVMGTAFTVERLTAGVRVSVERGVVKVVSGRNEMRLTAGAAEVVPLESVEVPPPLVEQAPARTRERAPSRALRPASNGARPIVTPKDEPGGLIRASEEARRAGRPEEAVTLLRRLLDRHARDPRAPYAAFILGRVLLEELARPREAAAAFADVPARDPRTPLAEDALVREVESWSRAGDLERARQRARVYLGRYQNGGRADEVRRYSRME